MAGKHSGASGRKNKSKSSMMDWILRGIFAALCIAVCVVAYLHAGAMAEGGKQPDASGQDVSVSTPAPADKNDPKPTATPETTPEPTPEPTPTPIPFEAYAVESTRPENLISSTGILTNGAVQQAPLAEGTGISFGTADEYNAIPGIPSFRGNNYRDSAYYGVAQITEKKFGSYWTAPTGTTYGPDGYFLSGNMWTGQALVAEWPKETRRIMNMYDWAKEADTLVEIIYPSSDGYIYFLEMETGQKTRDALYTGHHYKGTGSLDPRGYPLLYVGSGYYNSMGYVCAAVISLIDGEVLYEFGAGDTFSLRSWHMFDSAPLIDAETDTLIYPGESGLLYLVDLGTEYDAEAGTISIDPTVTKWRYQSTRSLSGAFWLGFEASPIAYQGYIYLVDNGGHLMCLNLDTLELVWAQDTLDDTNCTPVLSVEDGHPYLYISTSFHNGWRGWTAAATPVWKIDAETGEIIWQNDSYRVVTSADDSGGSQASLASGEGVLEDLVYVAFARCPNAYNGVLVALDKNTGEEVWRFTTVDCAWSTPTPFYDQNGNGYILVGTTNGYFYLLDGLTGERYNTMALGGRIDASPVVWNNRVIIGTRANQIFGIELK